MGASFIAGRAASADSPIAVAQWGRLRQLQHLSGLARRGDGARHVALSHARSGRRRFQGDAGPGITRLLACSAQRQRSLWPIAGGGGRTICAPFVSALVPRRFGRCERSGVLRGIRSARRTVQLVHGRRGLCDDDGQRSPCRGAREAGRVARRSSDFRSVSGLRALSALRESLLCRRSGSRQRSASGCGPRTACDLGRHCDNVAGDFAEGVEAEFRWGDRPAS